MPGLTDDQVASLTGLAPQGQGTSSSVVVPKQGLTDDQVAALGASPDVHERGRAALNGLTFGLGPRAMAAYRSTVDGESYDDAKADEYAKLEAYRKAHPWEALGYESAGSLPTLAVPGVGEVLGAGRVAAASANAARGVQVAQGLSTGGRLARAAGFGSEIGSVGSEVGAMGAKMAAANAALYDPTDYSNIGSHIKSGLEAAPWGYAGGRVLNRVGTGIADTVGNLAEALRVGSGARQQALNEIRTRVDESGRTIDQAKADMLPQGITRTITDPHKETILSAYHDALASGQSEQQAQQAAQAAYQGTGVLNARGQPLAASTALRHVQETLNAYHEQNATPLLASEILSGVDNPAKTGTNQLASEIMNTPGAGRDALIEAAQGRQEGAIPRTRDLIQDTFGEPDATGHPRNFQYNVADYVGTQNAIADQARAQNNALYSIARQNAQPFNLGGIIQGFGRRADDLAGNPRRALVGAVNDFADWWQRMQGKAPADILSSYRQARTSLTEDIGTLRNQGQRESAAQLQHMKEVMDRVVRGRNPDWWAANNQAAENFQLQNAATRGRELPFQEGPQVQEAKAWAQNATAPERDMFRTGVGRRALDQVAKMGTGDDVSRVFLKGGEDQMEEGVRGILGSTLTPENADRFVNQMQREKIANATYKMDKGSQTNVLKAGEAKRNALVRLATSAVHGINPIELVESLSHYALSKATAARDAEIGRMLATSTEDPRAMLALLNEIASTSPAHAAGLRPLISRFTELAQRSVVPSAAGFLALPRPDQKKMGFAAPIQGR